MFTFFVVNTCIDTITVLRGSMQVS